jgi:hypothetical protein
MRHGLPNDVPADTADWFNFAYHASAPRAELSRGLFTL